MPESPFPGGPLFSGDMLVSGRVVGPLPIDAAIAWKVPQKKNIKTQAHASWRVVMVRIASTSMEILTKSPLNVALFLNHYEFPVNFLVHDVCWERSGSFLKLPLASTCTSSTRWNLAKANDLLSDRQNAQYNKSRCYEGRYRFLDVAVSVYMVCCAMQVIFACWFGFKPWGWGCWLFLCRKDVHISE